MGEQTKNMLIGVFVIIACSLIIFFIMFLKPSVGDGKKTLYVRFSDINKITIGTRVMFAGKPVGEVVAIDEIYNAREQPIDMIGRVYFYQLVLKVDSSVQVYNTDDISLQTSGLLGEKSVAIIPKAPPKGVIPKLITGDQPIYAESVDPIENAFRELSEIANEMEATFHLITQWIQKHGEEVAATINSFGSAMDEIDTAVAEMNKEKVFTNTGAVMRNLKSTTQEIAEGTGTLGKLIKDEELYLRLNAIMSKVDTLMNDVNHYGLMFHLNKGWQRTRMQRLNEINALNTPSGFRQYFQDEIDDINTSMARLSLVVEKAQTSPQKEEIFQSTSFKEDFADLLREISDLAETLKLYNQQLMQAKK